MNTGTLALPTLRSILDPFVFANTVYSARVNDPQTTRYRAELRGGFGEVVGFICSDRDLDGELFLANVPEALIKVLRCIGANFSAGEPSIQNQIEKLIRYARYRDRVGLTILVFAHTLCDGHGRNDDSALAAGDRFVKQVFKDYKDLRNPDGTRWLVPIRILKDKVTGVWTIFNGSKSLKATEYLEMNRADRHDCILRDLIQLFSDRKDVPLATFRTLTYCIERNVEFLEAHPTPLIEQLRPGRVIIAVGKFPWVLRTDNVFVIGDYHRRYVEDIRVPLRRVGDQVGAIVTGGGFMELPDEPFQKPNAIRRSGDIRGQILEFMRFEFPKFDIPVVRSVLNWDTWKMKFAPRIATLFGYTSWAA